MTNIHETSTLALSPSPATPNPLFQNDYTKSSRIIYTTSVFARSSLLYLQEIGSLTALQPHGSGRENLNSYLFFIVTQGAGTLFYGGKQYELKKNDCVFIDCRKGYKMCASDHESEPGHFDELWSLSWIHFNGPTMSNIFDKYTERGGLPAFGCESRPGSHRAEEYGALHRDIFAVASSDSYVRDMEIAEKLTSLLRMLMLDAWDEKREGATGVKRMSVLEVKAYIDGHYQEKLSLDILARKYFISKEYLTKIFKEQYGFTVNGYVMHVRITKAKSLLRFTGLTIEEVGQSVGMPDANYFSRSFRKIEGTSPREYRKRW